MTTTSTTSTPKPVKSVKVTTQPAGAKGSKEVSPAAQAPAVERLIDSIPVPVVITKPTPRYADDTTTAEITRRLAAVTGRARPH